MTERSSKNLNATTANALPTESLRETCVGVTPLTARLEPWQERILSDPESLARLVKQHGSPLNIVQPQLLKRNLGELKAIAQQHGIEFQVYFARKANKCVSFVEATLEADSGLDVASLEELCQSLALGAQPSRLILTAAVKDRELVELAVTNDVCIAIDNADEARLVLEVAQSLKKTAIVALRLSGFEFQGEKLFSRFGVDIDQAEAFVESFLDTPSERNALLLQGIHFHLDGYDYKQRVAAIKQCLRVADRLAQRDHSLTFIDMGGGFPMNYIDSAEQWEVFWKELRRAILGEQEPITYQNHTLGLRLDQRGIRGTANIYPSYHQHTTTRWLTNILEAPAATEDEETIAQALNACGLQLRCEPGRSLLNGCGMTVAKVCYVKQHSTGHHLIGLSMNSTQCRTMHDDFLVDPFLMRRQNDCEGVAPISGFLTGAYCTESELLTWRRLNFPKGVSPGDLVVWPNTAGYLMHFRESRSHQFPLAKNLVLQENGCLELDPIDR